MANLKCGFNQVALSADSAKALSYYWDNNPNAPNFDGDFAKLFKEQIAKAREALLQEVIAAKCPEGCKNKVLLTLDIGLTGVIDNQVMEGLPTIQGYQLHFAPVATVLCTNLPVQFTEGWKFVTLVDLTQSERRAAALGATLIQNEGKGAKHGREKIP